MKTAGQLIHCYTERLEQAQVYAPFDDAKAILAHAMGLEVEGPISLPMDAPIDQGIEQRAESYVQRREKREPLARILGFTYFWGLKFQMADKVFRPDPQTEALVEHVLLCLEKRQLKTPRILDLGTGSGCLLLALLHSLPKATGVGVDRDEPSLLAAQKNAAALGLQDRVQFVQSNWGANVEERFDLIISNPPAVIEKTIPLLDPEMREYETRDSLVGGADGLDCYRAIIKGLDRLLKPDGVAVLRAHTWEREARLLTKAGFSRVEVKGNYRNAPCCVVVGGMRKQRSLWGRVPWLISGL